MTRVFFTSDLHLGHARVAEIRGFATIAEHDAAVLGMFDDVREGDTIYVLGDLAVGGYTAALARVAGLPGRKHFVPGNHDPSHPAHRRSYTRHFRDAFLAFDTIAPFRRLRLEGHEIALSHFPYVGDGPQRDGNRFAEWRLPDLGLPLLHGHEHSTRRGHGRELHVGYDAWGRLVSEADVVAWLETLP